MTDERAGTKESAVDASAAASTEPLSAVAEALHYFGAHRPDSPRHAAWVALDKFLEGDPDVVLPSEPLAGSQAGSNGPSGSPTSPSGRDSAANVRDRLGAIARRELDDRTLTPGQALDLVELIDVAGDVLDWLTRMGYSDASNIVWNLRRNLGEVRGDA